MSLAFPDHPWLAALLGDAEIAAQLSAEAELAAMLRFEAALAEACARFGFITEAAAAEIGAYLRSCRIDGDALRLGMARDGVVVPALIAELRKGLSPAHAAALHFGATSQDVVDTALILRLAAIIPIFEHRLAALAEALDRLAAGIGTHELLGYTRMQAARPITWHDRIAAWRAPVERHRARLLEIRPRLLVVQLGGAVGTRDAYGAEAAALTSALARSLGIGAPPLPWHTARDNVAEFAGWLSLVTGSLGKIGQDIALLAQMEAVSLRGSGGSSAMPHKHNPVAAEALVTLARFNTTQLAGMHATLVHEQERSGSAWTLEWMLLPQMLIATGSALLRARETILNLTLR